MKFKKIVPFALSLFLLPLSGCNDNNSGTKIPDFVDDGTENEIIEVNKFEDPDKTSPVYDGRPITVSQVITNSKGTHIEVEGKPFAFIGTQIRVDAFMNCDKLNYDEVDLLFGEAEKLGVTCVQIPLEWAKLEVEKDLFDYEYMYRMMSSALKHNLKMEFLWFGTNMCGDSHSYTVPDYILRDGKTYPKFDALRTGEYWNYYGIMWFLDFDHPNLIARETNALQKAMDYIYEFDSTHGAKKPVIGMQILNEPDIFIRFRVSQQQVLSNTTGEVFTEDEAYTKICNSLNALGKIVKNSKYRVYTRVNLASSTNADAFGNANGIYSGSEVKDAPSFAKRFHDLEGIDIVGDDAYTSSIKNVKGLVYMFGNKIENNFGHLAENDGNYSNTASLILTAAAMHGGYSIYDLITSPFFVENNTANIDQGIILFKEGSHSEFVYKKHYEQTKSIIEGIKMIAHELYDVDYKDFIAFNVANDNAQTSLSQTISTTHTMVSFTTSEKAIGFGVDLGDHVDFYFTAPCKISLSNGTVTNMAEGTYNSNGEFVTNQTLTYSSNISLEANKLYSLSYTSSGSISSTTWDFIGG